MIGSFGGFGGMGLGALSGLGGFAPTPEQIQERLKAAGIPSYTPPAPVVTPRPTPVVTPKPMPVMPIGGAYTSIGPNLRSGYTPTTPIAPPPVAPRPTPVTRRPSAPVTPSRIRPNRFQEEAEMARKAAEAAAKKRVAPKPAPVIPPNRVGKPVSGGEFIPETSPQVVKKRVAPKPVPVTPPNRVGQPVSAGEFIPEPTVVAPKPVTPTTPERAPTLQKRIDEINADVKRSNSTVPVVNDLSQGYRLLGGAVDSYKKKLDEGADYFEIDNVDRVDSFYDVGFREILRTESGILSPFDVVGGEATIAGGEMPSDEVRVDRRTYFDKVKAPDYLQDFLSPATREDAVAAYSSVGDLQKSSDIASALSDHYGYEIEPTEQKLGRFGGNLKAHTSSSSQRLAEFNSFVEPILSEQLPYLQIVEGFSYEDALQEAHKRDPMLQALYAKYDVTPLRYDGDGSEYLYDPFTYGEIRTFKVDKPSFFEKVIKVVPALLATAVLGPAAASLVGAAGATGATATALSGALASAGGTAITGGDTNDILKSALTGGVGGYAKGLTANAANLSEAAAQSAFTLGGGADPALFQAANAAAKTADTFGKVVQGAKFVDAAVDGNIAGAAISLVGPTFTKTAMDKVGLDEEFLEGYNINQNDAVAGLVKTELELAKGTDFGDAIARGFGEYIMEGGALGPNNVGTPEFIKKIGDALAEAGSMFDDAILQPAKGFVEGTVEVLGDVAEPVVDVIEDVAGAVIDKAPLIEDAVKATGSAIEDVVKPIVDPIIDAAPVVEDAVKAVGSTVDDVILQPAKELVEDVIEAAPDVDVDLPKVDVDLPKVDLPRPSVSRPRPTQTPSRTPSIVRTPGIIEERGAELFDLGEQREREIDPIAAYLANIAGGGMANGGAVRSSYGNLDELLRIVGGK